MSARANADAIRGRQNLRARPRAHAQTSACTCTRTRTKRTCSEVVRRTCVLALARTSVHRLAICCIHTNSRIANRTQQQQQAKNNGPTRSGKRSKRPKIYVRVIYRLFVASLPFVCLRLVTLCECAQTDPNNFCAQDSATADTTLAQVRAITSQTLSLVCGHFFRVAVCVCKCAPTDTQKSSCIYHL